MRPGRSWIAGSTSGHCPIHDVKEKTLKPSILKSGTWSHRMSEWAILINWWIVAKRVVLISLSLIVVE